MGIGFKKISIIIGVIVLSLVGCSRDADSKKVNNVKQEDRKKVKETGEKEKIAKAYIENLLNGNYDEAYNNYEHEERMKTGFSTDVMKQVIDKLKEEVGELEEYADVYTKNVKGYDTVSVTTKFEKEWLDMNVMFTEDNLITGVNFTVAVEPDTLNEVDVTIGEGEWELPGTLTIPDGEGPYKVAVLVHGSGPNDRDETI